MKKLAPYILLTIVIIALFIVIINKKENNTTKIITVNTLHSYLYNNEQMIEIPIFVTGEKAVIKEIESYENAYIFNNEGNKLVLELKEITSGHSENYLGETYVKYVLKFKMPNLTENININDAYLNITLINQTNLTLKIGELHLSYINNTNSQNWLSLDSKRILENSNKLQMDYIVIKFEEVPLNIDTVHIDTINNLNFEIINDELYIEISEKELLINYIPLWIKLSDDTYITFNNHHYTLEYNLLEKALRELNIYVLH